MLMQTFDGIDKNISISEILERAAEYSDKVLRIRAGEFDQQEAVPDEIIQEMGEMGFLGAPLPEEYGGLGMDMVNYGYLTEMIGKGCNSTRALLTVHTSLVSQTILKLGNKEQKERYLNDFAHGYRIGCFALSEPDCGSDANSVRTTYQKQEDGFLINGKKKWITLGAIADVFLVFASRGDMITAFLIDAKTPGIKVEAMSGLMGNRAAHMAEIEFKDVLVPSSNVLGREGGGFSFVANTALVYGRYSIAWAGVAVAQAALEEMSSYAKSRDQFGKKIGQFQLIQALIADAVTEIHAARALCISTGRLLDTDFSQAVMEVNIAKQFAAQTAIKVTADAVQVFGGNGCWNRYPVERLYREARILSIIEGTHQIQQLMIGKYGIKKYGNIHYDSLKLHVGEEGMYHGI